MAIRFKGAHFPTEVILMGVRWYVAYPLSTRHVEKFMEERGVEVDHSTMNRWGIKYRPQLEEACHRRKRPVWVSWQQFPLTVSSSTIFWPFGHPLCSTTGLPATPSRTIACA